MFKKKNKKLTVLLLFVAFFAVFNVKDAERGQEKLNFPQAVEIKENDTAENIYTVPVYKGSPYTVINNNVPEFEEREYAPFETYSELDGLGRSGAAFALIGRGTMPDEKRGSIGSIKPSGWHTIKYDIIKDRYLYNRCHLIAYSLAGENANEKNLITGTRYMNVEGMLPFEIKVAEYVQRTGNSVLYRVTPVFKGDNLLADGVQMEAKSVEDGGRGICFNVYCYNVQPGIEIDYRDGSSRQIVTPKPKSLETDKEAVENPNTYSFIANKNTKKFHLVGCKAVKSIKKKNTLEFKGSRNELIDRGYKPCKSCNP